MLQQLPETLYKGIHLFADEFGGLPLLKQHLQSWTAQTLITFPGPIRLVKPWQLEIDLLDYEFIPGSTYSVFNSRWQKLYTYHPTEARLFRHRPADRQNYFGYDVRDLAAVMLSPHTDILYLSFRSIHGRRVLLLWVCNELPPDWMTQWIKTLTENYQNIRYQNRTDYLNLRQTQPVRTVQVIFLAAPRRLPMTAELLKHNPAAELISDNFAADGYIDLSRSGWYLFEEIIDHTAHPVSLVNLTGTGLTRLEMVSQGLIYIKGMNAVQVTANLSNLFSFDSNISTATEFLRVDADLS